MPGRNKAIILAAAISCISSPEWAHSQSARPSGLSDEELFGTVIRNSKWPSSAIPVCWENPSPSDAAYRSITRSAVEETWQHYSKIKFIGWGSCVGDSKGIRILIADEGPHVKAVGKYLDARPNGMVLNFTFATWSPRCMQKVDFCAYAIAVHEFGHAIGFTHEQNRDDAPAECRAEAQGTDGDYKVTEYDPISVMNYCSPKWNGDGKLSELDIQALQKFYGMP